MSGRITMTQKPPFFIRTNGGSRHSGSRVFLLDEHEVVTKGDNCFHYCGDTDWMDIYTKICNKSKIFFLYLRRMILWIAHGATLGVVMELLAHHDGVCGKSQASNFENSTAKINTNYYDQWAHIMTARVGLGTFHLVFSIIFEAFQCWKFLNCDHMTCSQRFWRKSFICLYAVSYIFLTGMSFLLFLTMREKPDEFCTFRNIMVASTLVLLLWETVEIIKFAIYAHSHKIHVDLRVSTVQEMQQS